MASADVHDYPDLRRTGSALRRLARPLGLAVLAVGSLLFYREAAKLLQTGFGLGERIEIGLLALGYLGTAALLALLATRLLGSAADLVALRLDQADLARRTLATLAERLLPALDRLEKKLDRPAPAVSASPTGQAPPAGVPKPAKADPSNLSSAELLRLFNEARSAGDPLALLEIRSLAASRLPEDRRKQLDQDAADWLARHFLKSLRAGKAPDILPAMERAVVDLGDQPALHAVKEALPHVRLSVELKQQAQREIDDLDDDEDAEDDEPENSNGQPRSG